MLPRAEAPGAIPLVLHAQLAGLQQQGHEVTIASAAAGEAGEDDALAELRASGVDVHVGRRTFEREGRWRRRYGLAARWVRGGEPWRSVWFAPAELQVAVDSLVATRSFDVVDLQDNSMGGLRLPTQLARVLSEHEVRRPRRPAPPPAHPVRWPAWAQHEADWRRWPDYQRRVWSAADVVQVFTDRDAEGVAQLAPDLAARIRVNPFGVAPLDLPHAEPEASTLAFVGNFSHPPNVDAARWLAGEVLPSLRADGLDARLLLAGSAMPRELRELAGAGVEVLPDVPRVESVLARATVVVAPIRTGGGMRMKVVQAMAAGKAVVTTPRGAEGIDLTSPAPLAVAETAESIVGAIARLLGHPDERRELAGRAREHARRFHSPQAYAERLEASYVAAIEARSRA
jgi:glycosyltransferase involved in cell wall biosynthesis